MSEPHVDPLAYLDGCLRDYCDGEGLAAWRAARAVVDAALTLAANEAAHWAVYGDDAASQAEHILNVGVAVRSLLGQPEPEWKSMMPPPSGSTSADRAWVIG